MMTVFFAIFMLVLGGIALSVQSSINGRLGHNVGVIASAWLTFVIGFAISFLLFFFFESNHEVSLFSAPKWQLSGALFGVMYMLIVVFAVPKIGIAAATVCTISGQLIMSLLIDHFGWLENKIIPLDDYRYFAILLLVAAVTMIYLSNKRIDKKEQQVLSD
ncbi:DMT family transporter [Marinomonas primoryensis]|jgi:transporter family-2 protein|uniref:DMT family transporter n=2 Tax=Marinomonas primoryensis TaxID=178399 RepID=A0ABV0L1M3_9GAMM|nr:DMT family transporter [Marinomonas primoryensis]|tara:strand:- start:472 stop:954 length:483 start_codon:yes stop_codon:yes gene_type:complete